MLWEEYYENLGYWATSTMVSRMSKLESFGPADQVAEVILNISFDDTKGATRLLKKATAAGVKFTAEQLTSFSYDCAEDVVLRAVHASADCFTSADLDELYTIFDDALLLEIAGKYNIKLPESLSEYETEDHQPDACESILDELDYILECLSAAHNHLAQANNFGLVDLFRAHREWTVLKYACVEDAQHYIECAIQAWNYLEHPRKDTYKFPAVFPGIGPLDMCLDFWHGGFWMASIAQKEISKLMRTVEKAITAVENMRKDVRH